MAGPLARSYGAATMAGKDERNGRINPALESDDDLPVAEARRLNQQTAQAQVQKMLSSTVGKSDTNKTDGDDDDDGTSDGFFDSRPIDQENTAF